MTALLERAIAEVSRLPEAEQEAVARGCWLNSPPNAAGTPHLPNQKMC